MSVCACVRVVLRGAVGVCVPRVDGIEARKEPPSHVSEPPMAHTAHDAADSVGAWPAAVYPAGGATADATAASSGAGAKGDGEGGGGGYGDGVIALQEASLAERVSYEVLISPASTDSRERETFA
jgi:hypothetical protein